MRTLNLLVCLALSWAFVQPTSARADGSTDGFTAEQRAEIVRILRDALAHDPSILRDALGALQVDDKSQQDRVARAAITAAHDRLAADPADPVAGNAAGDVTIVEFYDTRCPYCRKLDPVMAALVAQDHNVRVVFKDIPILGPASVLGARAALAAQRQGAYDRLRAALMRPGAELSAAAIRAQAERLGLDAARLAHDMDDPAIQARIDANLALAHSLNIQGTPAMVIGDTLLPGAVELADLQQAVAAARAARN